MAVGDNKRFNYLEFDHEIGDINCRRCWPNYPRYCNKCGYLVHAELGDTDANDNYWLKYECEFCHSLDNDSREV